ncbi:MAG: TIGR03915 family putative DNA repair protein [Dysgonamonadaceae bacterium]|jgi:probable DNA metabolism protein|nr:TIGR03915 family putative DNA repair protein [Dysgonamonadaceae bacterium]
MLYYQYDKSFEGFLTCIFDAYNRKELPCRMVDTNEAVPLFTDTHEVVTDTGKAGRVLQGLRKRISKSALNMLFICYLSEMPDIELRLFRYIQKSLTSSAGIEVNFADDDVLFLSKIYKKVQSEINRIKQFVRFQKTTDGMYFAVIAPLYNVLPLCSDFFQDRYADQQWIIYDSRRNFGLFYDLKKTELIWFDNPLPALQTGNLAPEQQDDCEKTFQNVWKDYLKATTIQERKNLKLQRRFMPQRFWEYLVEKR